MSRDKLGIKQVAWLSHPLPGSSDGLRERSVSAAKAIVTGFTDLLYPPRCLVCTSPTVAARNLCGACWRDAEFIAGTRCHRCGVPLPGTTSGALDCCETCNRHPPAWDAGRAVMMYGGSGRSLILALKHGDRLDLVPTLGEWMYRAANDLLDPADMIVPVPLHWRRLLHRRCNQSAELARWLSRRTGRPCVPDLLRRRKATLPQVAMSREARRENQADAFELRNRARPRVRNARIVLIDDVLTSGATLSSCAATLRDAGAAEVDILVIARAAHHSG